MITARDRELLAQAAELAFECPPTQKAFSVGCILANAGGQIISTGYSREQGEASHAEAVAIEKALKAGADMAGATLYTSLEPCSTRISGKTPCCNRIIEANIRRVVFCAKEPPVFVVCEGVSTLKKAGIGAFQDLSVLERVKKANPGLF